MIALLCVVALLAVGALCVWAARIDFVGWWILLGDHVEATKEQLATRRPFFDEQTHKPLDWSDFPELRELRPLGRPVGSANRERRAA